METINFSRKKLLIAIFIIGIIIPFIPIVAFAEVFFGIIPFSIIIVFGLTLTIIAIIQKRDLRSALFILLIVPFFVITQILSGYVVNKIQRFRSENMIAEIERLKMDRGFYPENYNAKFGIEYSKDSNDYKLEYSRGFLVTEKFNSRDRTWKSYGWND